jgi:hypothetical protein
LRPIKAKNLIVSTALKNNLPVEVVTEIIAVYWKDVRTALSTLVFPKVHVSNLGDFIVKHWLIEKEKEHIHRIMNGLKPGIRGDALRLNLESKLILIDEMEEKRLGEEQRKDFIKSHKKSISNVKSNISK